YAYHPEAKTHRMASTAQHQKRAFVQSSRIGFAVNCANIADPPSHTAQVAIKSGRSNSMCGPSLSVLGPAQPRGVTRPAAFFLLSAGQLCNRVLSFPKIISGRNGDASRTRLGWRQWRRTAGLPDPAACLCPMPSAYGPDCNTPHKKKEFAAGAIRQRSASGPSTRDARCQSDAPRTDFAKAIQARSV